MLAVLRTRWRFIPSVSLGDRPRNGKNPRLLRYRRALESLADKLMILALTELDARGGAAIPISEIQAVFRYEFAFQLDQPPPFFFDFFVQSGCENMLAASKGKGSAANHEGGKPPFTPACCRLPSLITHGQRPRTAIQMLMQTGGGDDPDRWQCCCGLGTTFF